MADLKKLLFNADNAEEYFSMLLTCYRDTANDIFRRDNEGRHASEQHYSAEYQKYLGMQIAMREVLEYFGKYDLGGWISVKDRLPEYGEAVLVVVSGKPHKNITLEDAIELAEYAEDGWILEMWPEWMKAKVTYWMPLPEPPEEA